MTEADMVVLGAGFVVALVLTATIAIGVSSRLPAPAGGPTRWGRGCAAKVGPAPAALALAVLGWLVAVAVTLPVGLAGRAGEASFDRPLYRWVSTRVHASHLSKLMTTLTRLGNRDTMELVALVSLIVLATAYGRRACIPLVAIVAAVVMQREAQILLARLVPRDAPAINPDAGIFPSGGVSRIVAVYGLIIVLSVRLLPDDRQARWRVHGMLGLALMTVVEAYTRIYLSVHWATDVLAGVVLGVLLLVVEVTALNAMTS